MRPEDLAGLPNYSGIYFDPMTGKTYLEDGSDTGYTFERARWSGPFGIDFSWPWLNPISFATAETGQRYSRGRVLSRRRHWRLRWMTG